MGQSALQPQHDQRPVAEWSFFRGNNYDGHSHEQGLTNVWPKKGPPVIWSIDLGAGYSGFVGKLDRIYTQYQTLTGQFVVCLDAKTGAKIWEHRYGWSYGHASMYPGPRSTPTICNDRLFYTTPLGSLGCLKLQTGDRLWEVDTTKDFKAPDVEFGYACSPVCIAGKVIVPVGGSGAAMVAFDQRNGEVIWNSGDYHISYCSAYPISFESRSLIVGYFKNAIGLFDTDTGEELARRDISNDYDEHSAWPIYREPFLWTSGPFRAGCRLLKLAPIENGFEFRSVYQSELMSNDVASCVLDGDQLYGFDIRDVQSKIHRPSRGQFTCLDFNTGDPLWQNGSLTRRDMNSETISSETIGNASDIGHASVIAADGKLILLNDTGQLIVGEINPLGFEEMGRSTILGGEICWTGLTLMNKCVFARNQSKAICVYLGEADQLSRFVSDESSIRYANDLEQPKFVNLAPILLGTEPKYAMTAPRPAWLVNWYLISLGLGWITAPVLAIAIHRILPSIPARQTFLLLAFLVGILGTTIFGRWLGVFYFSWPVALFIIFECVVCQLQSRDAKAEVHPWRARFWLLVFLAICFLFFWLCRRLSLAFEWAFLLGFPFSIPFLWIEKASVQRKEEFSAKQWLCSAFGFSVFYWAGAAVIMWKYSA